MKYTNFLRRLQRLRESGKLDFNVKSVISNSSISKWENESNKKLFTAAKAGDQSALEYIFWKMEPAILKTFWNNYLGPNREARARRIHSESAWEEWLGIAWQVLRGGYSSDVFQRQGVSVNDDAYLTKSRERDDHGAIDQFDVSKTEEDRLFNVFALRFRQLLQNAAYVANMSNTRSGITKGGGSDINVSQYDPVWMEGKQEAEGAYSDEVFDEVYESRFRSEEESFENAAFLKKWKSFTSDPFIYKNITKAKEVSPAHVFKEVLTNSEASYVSIGQKYGISRNSVFNMLQRTQNLMEEEYSITGQELMKFIERLGNKKIASYFDVKDVADVKKVELSFLERFKQGVDLKKMWEPQEGELNAAHALLWWIQSGFKDAEDVADDYGFNRSRFRWFLKRAFHFLAKVGIEQTEVIKEAKKVGAKKLTDLIGAPTSN